MRGPFRTFAFRRLGFRRWQAGAPQITPVPQTGSGVIALLAGDDYLESEERQLRFIDSSKTWPSLSGASVKLIAFRDFGGASLSVAGTVKTTTAPQEVDVGLTHSQTETLLIGEYAYDLVATLSDGATVSLNRGALTAATQTQGGFPVCQR